MQMNRNDLGSILSSNGLGEDSNKRRTVQPHSPTSNLYSNFPTQGGQLDEDFGDN